MDNDWPGTAIYVTAISFSNSNNAIVKNNSIIDSTDASVSGIIGASSVLIDSNYINIYATEENSAVSGVTVSNSTITNNTLIVYNLAIMALPMEFKQEVQL